MSDFFKGIPGLTGKLAIYPSILDRNYLKVNILGDPEGLRSLAETLNYLADWDQDQSNMPIGEREHIHLNLGECTCEVEICRADAKGTRKLPDFMDAGI